ncbi:MAG: hypothetical protein U9Q81_11815 [Pseudomonadota bacterium]|nr:hypothetical protein [Pseudomonadota bacterium]
MRLDPKLRYLAELAARKQRRSLSSFIEWAVEESLSRVLLHEGSSYQGDPQISIADQAAVLWDVDDAERFVRLAMLYEDLLTHKEQVLWKLVKDSGLVWLGGYSRYGSSDPDWDKLDREVFPQLRKHWDLFLRVARGEASPDDLPTWEAPKLQKPTFDDEIPF